MKRDVYLPSPTLINSDDSTQQGNLDKGTAIACESADAARYEYMQQLARQLSLPQVAWAQVKYAMDKFGCILVITDQHLELRTQNIAKPLYVDFLSPSLNYRRLQSGKRQLLAKAVGIKAGYRPDIVDATAGLGTDGFILACLGCRVQWLERSLIVAALLQDGLNRFQLQQPEAPITLTLMVTDAISWLNALSSQNWPDVIYLDPMFPQRNKAALGKLTMRILYQLVGGDEDAKLLLTAALQRAKKRVVVKRPRLAPVIGGCKPDLVYSGTSSRFDVYLCNTL